MCFCFCFCFAFIFLRLVYPMFPVSLDCPCLIARSVFSNVYILYSLESLLRFSKVYNDMYRRHSTWQYSSINYYKYKRRYLNWCARRVSGKTFIIYTTIPKNGKPNIMSFGVRIEKDLNMMANIGYGYLCFREENLSFNNIHITTLFRNCKFQ